MGPRTLAVVSAGLSQPSSTRLLADRLAAATEAALERRGVPVGTTVVEVREHAHDVVNHVLTGFPSEPLRAALRTVTGADGVIAVSPIFNASYSGLFKSFFDVLEQDALAGVPVLAGATGGSARHSLALEHAVRPMFTHLRAVVVPTAVFAAAEDWAGPASEAGPGPLAERIARAGDELAAEIARREPAAPPDPFTLTTTFDRLLAGE